MREKKQMLIAPYLYTLQTNSQVIIDFSLHKPQFIIGNAI